MLLQILFVSLSLAAEPKGLPWIDQLKAMGLSEVYVCGDPDIRQTRTSLKKHFLFGNPKRGYVLSGIPNDDQYWKILIENQTEVAKQKIHDAFSQSHLWQVSKSQLLDLGTPKQIDSAFIKTSIKDCIEKNSGTLQSCKEKFPSVRIFFSNRSSDHRLNYSGATQTTLKVARESKHRFCEVSRPLKF